MPPVDSRLRPDLTRAMPGDDLPPGEDNGHRSVGHLCEVQFGDGGWRDVMLVSWRRDRLGRWVAELQWSAQGATWTESYLFDREKIRRG